MIIIDILYNVFIYPIELFIKLVFETAYIVLGSYGFSLVMVSVVISIILLPIYHLVEKLQKEERSKRQVMQPQLDDLKDIYKGYELYLYTKAVYREHNYHPLSALQSSLGLLIQLPFLIAAYYFISNYTPLQGESFNIISDLSKPDQLLNIAGFGINVLPFVMSAFNIAGGYLYTRGLQNQGSLQIYIVALIFLVLLYQAPSGVLIYWTCSNIFSFIKYLILSFRS